MEKQNLQLPEDVTRTSSAKRKRKTDQKDLAEMASQMKKEKDNMKRKFQQPSIESSKNSQPQSNNGSKSGNGNISKLEKQMSSEPKQVKQVDTKLSHKKLKKMEKKRKFFKHGGEKILKTNNKTLKEESKDNMKLPKTPQEMSTNWQALKMVQINE